jgi:hypothetical protein
MRDQLKGEAQVKFAEARRVLTDAYELDADGRDFRRPVSYRIAHPGDGLRLLHEGEACPRLASELAAEPMEPSKVGYLYYNPGDRIGLHTDLPECQLVLLAAIESTAPPLVVHPELKHLTPEELTRLAEDADEAPDGRISLPLDDTSLVAMFGGGLPHQTRPVAAGSEAVVATLCHVGSPV